MTMQSVLAQLDHRAAAFARQPFFGFLSDAAVDARDRLAFAPCIAPHVLTFRDLCAHVVRDESNDGDRLQALVNVHSREDDYHWQWFLDDLGRLGDDPRLSFSDATRFLWSDATLQTRLLGHRLCKHAMDAPPLDRLLVLQCVEAAFAVALAAVASAVRAFTEQTGTDLAYFGAAHAAAEAAHTGGAEAERALAETALDAHATQHLTALVDDVFDAYDAWAHELLAFANARRAQASVFPARRLSPPAP